jgi:Domain of unknown function (DUF4190)
MTACATCARALQPAWKFCIYCGARVAPVEPVIAPVPTVEPATAPVAFVEPEVAPEPEPEPEAEAPTETSPHLADRSADPGPAPAMASRSRRLPSPVVVPATTGPILTLRAALAGSAPPSGVTAAAAIQPPPAQLPDEAPLTPPPTLTPAPTPPRLRGRAARLQRKRDAAPAIASLTETDATAERSKPAASVSTLVDEPDLDPDLDWDDDEPIDRTGSINPLAIIALIMGVLASPLGALFGHMALNQLKTSGERGVIPAWIAIVLGYLWLGVIIVLGISYLLSNG